MLSHLAYNKSYGMLNSPLYGYKPYSDNNSIKIKLIPSCGSGASWDKETIQQLLNSSGATNSVNQDTLNAFFQNVKQGYTRAEQIDSVALDLAAQLSKIRRSFGLNMTQLANVLKTSRKSPYLWMNGEVTNLYKKNKNRIDSLLSLADYWESVAKNSFAGKLQTKVGNNTLLSLLIADDLDVHRIKLFMDSINQSQTTYSCENSKAAAALLNNAKRAQDPMATATLGKPIYGTDPNYPGLIVEIHGDGRKVTGKMIDGRFTAIDIE